jgi:hypothetical protein
MCIISDHDSSSKPKILSRPHRCIEFHLLKAQFGFHCIARTELEEQNLEQNSIRDIRVACERSAIVAEQTWIPSVSATDFFTNIRVTK